MVVVVTGTVVGVVVVATGFVVVVAGAVVGSVVFAGDVVEETGDVVVETGEVVVVDVGAGVDVVVVVFEETTSVLAVEAKNPTRATDDNPEPTRRPWVTRRTRANCRSRC
jgi:streptogramin lyase